MNARTAAHRTLLDVLEQQHSLSSALENTLPQLASSQERAFAQALSYGVLRWYYRLDWILNQLLRKPLKRKEAAVRIAALLGLYQLTFSRVKPHAAVSETVALNPRWAKPLVNAVLRNYLRQRDALETRADANPCAASAHPDWMLDRLQRDWPQACSGLLNANNQPPPMTLRVDTRRCSRDEYLERLQAQDILARQHDHCDSAVSLETPVDVHQLPGFSQALVSVQDAAAQLAAPLLQIQAGERVLDVCAAPGGKTLHMLQHQPDLGELIAVDIATERNRRIDDNLQRAGLNARVISADASQPEHWWDGRPFDRILLDAPCSASGVIRRHPDIKYLRRASDIDALQATQQRLLQAIWPLLRQGGTLLYATCSVFQQENEVQIVRFMQTHTDAKESPIQAGWGQARPHGRQILTGDTDMDGFYYARLTRQH